MEIEFDPAKDEINKRKHGISLTLAAQFGPEALVQAGQLVKGEQRFRMIGRIDESVITAVVVFRKDRLRVISVRHASRKERRDYGNQIRHS